MSKSGGQSARSYAHGQRLHWHIQDHATLSGILATQQKEKLENLIADQFELGKGKYLLRINLKDLETTSGKTQQAY